MDRCRFALLFIVFEARIAICWSKRVSSAVEMGCFCRLRMDFYCSTVSVAVVVVLFSSQHSVEDDPDGREGP